MPISPAPRPDLMTIAPYVGGQSKLAGGGGKVIKLSSNEGAFGVPPAARRALERAALSIHRYPDGHCTKLRAAIGGYFGLDPARLVCGAGADDLIAMLCHAYGGPGTDLVMSDHGFLMYDIYGRVAGCNIIKAPERDFHADPAALLAAVTPATRLLFLTNPNNPTGTLIASDAVKKLRADLRGDVLLVLDSAYAEYVDDPAYDGGRSLVESGDNTVMLRSFSKIFGLGGARVGWAYAPEAVVDVLHRVRGPFNVSAASQDAAAAALSEADWVQRSRAHNSAQRTHLTEALRGQGLIVLPSQTNFILVDFGTASRAAAADAKLKEHGILVRAVASYGLPNMLRITIGLEDENTAVAAALSELGDG